MLVFLSRILAKYVVDTDFEWQEDVDNIGPDLATFFEDTSSGERPIGTKVELLSQLTMVCRLSDLLGRDSRDRRVILI